MVFSQSQPIIGAGNVAAIAGAALSASSRILLGNLVRALSAIDESKVPDIHSLAASLMTRQRLGSAPGHA